MAAVNLWGVRPYLWRPIFRPSRAVPATDSLPVSVAFAQNLSEELNSRNTAAVYPSMHVELGNLFSRPLKLRIS